MAFFKSSGGSGAESVTLTFSTSASSHADAVCSDSDGRVSGNCNYKLQNTYHHIHISCFCSNLKSSYIKSEAIFSNSL